MNWIILYNSINLKAWKEVAMEALPSYNSLITHPISSFLLVNGEAIDASA